MVASRYNWMGWNKVENEMTSWRSAFMNALHRALSVFMSPCSGFARMRIAFFATIIFALCAHLFCWANSMFSHDSLMIIQNDWEHQIAIGRPFQQFYVVLRGSVAAPWLIGMLGTVFLAGACMLIVTLLKIRIRALVILTGAVLATCTTVTLINATYIDWFDIFMLALLLSCAGVYACTRKPMAGIFIGALLLCISMGLYQAYLQVAVVLVLTMCAIALASGSASDARHIGLRGLLTVLLGGLLYILVQLGSQFVFGVGASDEYNSVATAFSFGDATVLDALVHVWQDPFAYLLFPETHAVRLCAAINAVLLALTLVAFIIICMRHRNKCTVVFAIVVLAFVPLGAGCINFAAYGNVHGLMILSYYLFYPFLFSLLDSLHFPTLSIVGSDGEGASRRQQNLTRALVIVSAVLVSCVVFSNIIYANQVYLKKDLMYQSTSSTLTRLESDLEDLDGYVPGKTPVILIGSLAHNDVFSDVRQGFPPDDNQTDSVNGRFTDYATGLEDSLTGSITFPCQMRQFFTYVLGCPINILEEESLELLNGDEGNPMPVFPRQGSVLMDDGVAIVRLSDW